MVNNDTDYATRPSSPGISIIDLAFTNPDFGLLRVWEIPEEYSSLSDHEMILLEWEDLPADGSGNQAAMTGWNIQKLLEDQNLLQAAQEDWKSSSKMQAHLSLSSTKEDLDKEVEWFEVHLEKLLNGHAKVP